MTVISLLASVTPAIGLEPPEEPSGNTPEAKIEAELTEELDTKGEAPFVVKFEDRPDLSAATGIADWDERGWFVYNALAETAERSQTAVRSELDALGIEYDAFWIANVIIARSDASVVETIASFSEVERIGLAEDLSIPEPQPGAVGTANETQAVEWGLSAIRADEAWDVFDATGEGIVVGVLDTGALFDHPALVDQYRGNDGDGSFTHEYNWLDPADQTCPDETVPCDNDGHGTHVTGTIVGDDGGGNQIGVAPNAEWIAAQGCEGNGCSQAALLGAGQFLATPTDFEDANPKPGLRPHIINNSWGGPGGDLWYQDLVDTWIAFGIFPMFSSGNPGNDCSAAGSPGDYSQSYSSGAFDSDGDLYFRSGRGPSLVDGGVKPNISAPGVDVRSAWNDGSYNTITGTSMASPHVSGSVALMWSVAPQLIGDIDNTRDMLDLTAVDTENLSCGGTPEKNNVWGEGKLDIYSAIEMAPRGNAGLVAGVVASAQDGGPLGGATVTITGGADRVLTTADDGSYSTPLAAGEYLIEVAVYGYETGSETVVVEDGVTSTVDFDLVAAPTVTVSGTVTDGSGQGWPLYARVDIEGFPNGPVFSDPETGVFQVELLENVEYDMAVTVDGYAVQSRAVSLPESANAQDFQMTIAPDVCEAPGYAETEPPLSETFDDETLPEGWTVIDHVGNGEQWAFDNPGGRDNMSGGEGGFAILDRSFYGSGTTQNSDLVTPMLDMSDAVSPKLAFNHDFRNVISSGTARIDLTVDGGETWQVLWQETGSKRGPRVLELPIPQAAGKAEVQIRFNYAVSLGYWWQLDNVTVTDCSPVTGGLITGQVTDVHTGAPVNGATIALDDDPAATTEAFATPDDPGLGDGFYILFSPTSGPTAVTATGDLYETTTETVEVVQGEVVTQSFELGSGQLKVTPGSVETSVVLGDSATADVELANNGTSNVTFQVKERTGAFQPMGESSSPLSLDGAPVSRIEGDFSPYALGASNDEGQDRHAAGDQSVTAEPWVDIDDLPTNIMDNSAVAHDGYVYSMGGIGGINSPAFDMVFRYDPSTDTWELVGRIPDGGREKPAVEVLNDKIHVVGGWRGEVVTNHAIFDPAEERWTVGAEIPNGYGGSASAVLDGEMYVIGGCAEECGTTDVFRYDPAADEWSTLAPYPEPVSWGHCGAIGASVICAGGMHDDTAHVSAYSYDPILDEWSSLPDMPRSIWAGSYGSPTDPGTGEQVFIVSGGVIDGFQAVTNEGFAFNPEAGEWQQIPNSNHAWYRGASACGFYKIGGSVDSFLATDQAELLPGLVDCGAVDVDWMATDEIDGALEPGESTTISVTVDSEAVNQPGTYTASLAVRSDTPNQMAPIGVTMGVEPTEELAEILGTVSSSGRCDVPQGPVSGAVVQVDGGTVYTDADGNFSWWVTPEPHQLAVTHPGYVIRQLEVEPDPGDSEFLEVNLRLDTPCEDISAPELNFETEIGATKTSTIDLGNNGATEFTFEIDETTYQLGPIRIAESTTAGDDRGADEPAPVGPWSIRSTDMGELDEDPVEAAPWFGGAGVPQGRLRYGTAQCDGDDGYYVIGGVNAAVDVTASTVYYDPVANSWTALAPIPVLTEGQTAVCAYNRIHVIGGSGVTYHLIYDIATDSWSYGAPLPRGVWGAAMGFWEGKIYVAGGASEFLFGTETSEVNVYDVATDTCLDNAGDMPAATVTPGSAQIGHYLYVVGGWDGGSPETNVATMQRLNMIDGTWELGPALPEARGDFALSATNQALYAIGGDEPGNNSWDPTNTVTRLELDDWVDNEWIPIETLPIPVMAHRAGACTTGIMGGEIWSAAGVVPGSRGVNATDRTFFREVPGEDCASVRSDVPWLSVTPATGRTGADDVTEVEVTVDGSELEVGEYHATLLIQTSDAATVETRLPVTLTVTESEEPPTTEPPTTEPPTTEPPTTGPPTTEPP
ncbi:MAG: S8 family serine peptidase, partial [Acidimicrobiia bacterium]|nr:S8 family serine peptidase [Acidimicrobiia bacterium]